MSLRVPNDFKQNCTASSSAICSLTLQSLFSSGKFSCLQSCAPTILSPCLFGKLLTLGVHPNLGSHPDTQGRLLVALLPRTNCLLYILSFKLFLCCTAFLGRGGIFISLLKCKPAPPTLSISVSTHLFTLLGR